MLRDGSSMARCRMGVNVSVGETFLPGMLKLLEEKIPGIHMEVLVGNTVTIEEKLNENEIDFAVVDGLKGCGLFAVMAQRLLTGRGSLRRVTMILVLLPFFTSMLVTNDVSLITFVPFAVLILQAIGRTDRLIPVIVLQTVAANLGSMATPVGNPQNLYIYAKYSVPTGYFFAAVLPIAGASLVLLILAVVFGPKGGIEVNFGERAEITHVRRLALCIVLFIMCLLAVMRVVHYGAVTVVVFLTLLLVDRAALKQVDYCLLLTFVFFFIFCALAALPTTPVDFFDNSSADCCVEVQVSFDGPNNDNPNYIIQVGSVFGFIISIENVL